MHELAAEPARQPHARLDLNPADRDGLDADAEWDAQATAEGHQLKRSRVGMLDGGVESVVGVAQVVLDPARHLDAEPAEKLQRLHRAAHRQGEHDRDRIETAVATLVGIVGHQILGGVDVVDDLGDEVRATGLLLGGQAKVLVAFASVPLGYRDAAKEQVGVNLGAEQLGPAQRRRHRLVARGGANENSHPPSGVLRRHPVAKALLGVLRRRAVDDDRRAPGRQVSLQVVGRIHRRQERERPFLGVAVRFVIDVVEDQAVQAERVKALEGDIGDLLGLLRSGRQPRRGQREEQEFPLAGDDATREIHARDAISVLAGDTGRCRMKAIVVTDEAAGTAGMTLVDRPEPPAAINDVIVQIHASGFVPTEMEWPSTWADRVNRDRTPSIPGHELAGVVTALGYGTTGVSVGQRVLGLADWHRDGTLAEYVAIEARNLAPLPGDVDFTVGASLPISGLTAWQGLFDHGRLRAGQSVLAHGAAGAVGTMVTQIAREAGAYVIGNGRAADRQKALDFGAAEFVDLDNDALEDVGDIDLVFDVIGGDIQKRSASLIRAGGTLVTITGPPEARPADGLAVDFVVESHRAQLSEIVQRVRDGRLRTNIGNVATLDDAVAALNPTKRLNGKTIIRIRP